MSREDRAVVQRIESRTKRFYNNVNSKAVENVEEIATAVALIPTDYITNKNKEA
jgi:hypothetical protein